MAFRDMNEFKLKVVLNTNILNFDFICKFF